MKRNWKASGRLLLRVLLALLHYVVGSARCFNVVNVVKDAPILPRLVQIKIHVFSLIKNAEVRFGVLWRKASPACDMLHREGVVLIKDFKDFLLWLWQPFVLLGCITEIRFKILVLRLKALNTRRKQIRLERRLAKLLLKIDDALIRTDALLLQRGELICRKRETFSENRGGTVLIDELLDGCDGVEAHIDFLANAGGMARELAAQDSDNSNEING